MLHGIHFIAPGSFVWLSVTTPSLRSSVCETNTLTAMGDRARPRLLNSIGLEIAEPSRSVLPNTSLRPMRAMISVNEIPYERVVQLRAAGTD